MLDKFSAYHSHLVSTLDPSTVEQVQQHYRDNPREKRQGDPRLANPFEDFERTYPMAPCRRIEITPELIALDNAQRAAREAAITWRASVALEPKPAYVFPADRSAKGRKS